MTFKVILSLKCPLQVKCDQYWPSRGTETYGLIQVTLLDTVELATYCVRTFALYKVLYRIDFKYACWCIWGVLGGGVEGEKQGWF